MSWQEFAALLALATAMSFTPGPNTMLSTAMAANHGLGHAMRFVCAVPVGWSALLLCTAGAGALVFSVPLVKGIIQFVGVAYLLWLACRLSGSATMAQADQTRLDVGFGQGVALQFVNIKAWLLALAIVAGWIAGREDAVQRLAIVVPVMCFFAFTSNLLYASMGALLRSWLARGRRLLWFNRVMALVLALTALWLAFV